MNTVMTDKEIRANLAKSDSWGTSCLEARLAFLADMRERHYGMSECKDAWAWFYSGWCSHVAFSIEETYK